VEGVDLMEMKRIFRKLWSGKFDKTVNIRLSNYFDGVDHNGVISGWSADAQLVKVYINNSFAGETACDQYREDLAGTTTDPNCSFTFALEESHINEFKDLYDSVIIKVEFVCDNKVFDEEEYIVGFSGLYNQIVQNNQIAENEKGELSGLVDGVICGWHLKAQHANIYIANNLIASVDLSPPADSTKFQLSYTLDGANFKPSWREQDSVLLKVDYLSNNNVVSVYQQFISSYDLLNSITVLDGCELEEQAKVIQNSLLWDENYYFQQNSHKGHMHKFAAYDYLIVGKNMGYDPSPYFDTYYYLANNIDVANDAINPFYHYLIIGEIENRRPNAYFNPHLYLHFNPDLANWEHTLLSHFVLKGKDEGRVYNEFPRPESNNKSIDPYLLWRMENEPLGYNQITYTLKQFNNQPLISIVVPVYNPDKQLLIDCIESVINQSYPNWQLCLADDKSTEPYVRQVLKEYRLKDSRIKTVFRRKNGHISEASNNALELANGEWTALLDHDDLLHEHALYHVIKAVNENPDVALIYSDEDKIDLDGKRIEPHFKCDWNLDLLYSQNYLSHLGVYKTDIIKKIGGFRKGYEGSQDYDLLLRYSREINHANIIHIPKVLYHWRMVEGSTALASGEKSYTTDAGIKALEDHFVALGKDVSIEEGAGPNMYKVNWLIKAEPLVSLIIPTYNGYEITKQAIDSILEKTIYQNYEILLVDNNSNDETALAYFEELEQHEKVTVLRYPYPFNYSAINNFAAKQAKGEIIGLVNNDVEVINPEWLTEMASHALRDDVGCVGAMLYFENDTIQHAGVICGLGGVAGHSHKHFPKDHPGYFYRLKLIQNLSAVTAACLLVRKDVFEQVNGLNEVDLTVAFNDVDFCLKVQAAGYRNLWTPYAELYHYESISRGAEDNPEKVARFNTEMMYMKTTWNTDSKTDPCYSVNLTLAREDFSVGK
jgi:glycosyltransferase involved in cell wall biosynthesis